MKNYGKHNTGSAGARKRLEDGMKYMNSLGPRMTGSDAHNKFVGYIKKEIRSMGLKPKSDVKKFMRWEAKNSKVILHTKDGNVPISVSSPFPYSGVTGAEGIRGPLKRFSIGNGIVVLRLKDFKHLPARVAFNQKNSYPEGLRLPKNYKGPVTTAFVKSLLVPVFAFLKASAVICIWEGMSDDMVAGQYLNFILGYLKMPAVWVNETEGKKVLAACRSGAEATVILEADIENKAVGESVCAVIEGKNKDETVIINTHTDGPNCVEENGPIALLEMMRYFLKNRPERTLVFAFVSGHFRMPQFSHNHGIADQSTSLWLHNNKKLWNGKRKNKKAVAGVTLEHLGCTEWKDVNGQYVQTDPVDIEVVYTGNSEMDKIYFESLSGREHVRTVTLRPHNLLHFGEGQSLFNVGIPDIALVTAPDYLCVMSESAETEKFDLDLMVEQTESFIKAVELINERSADELGKTDGYSFGIGH